MRVISEEYEVDNVTVTVHVEWPQQAHVQAEVILYNVSVSPQVPVFYNGSTIRILTLEYNLEYNLTIEAGVHCESNATASFTLHYGEIIFLLNDNFVVALLSFVMYQNHLIPLMIISLLLL